MLMLTMTEARFTKTKHTTYNVNCTKRLNDFQAKLSSLHFIHAQKSVFGIPQKHISFARLCYKSGTGPRTPKYQNKQGEQL